MDMSQPDDDGVYRNGATKRKARTELAMQCSLSCGMRPARMSLSPCPTRHRLRRGRLAGTWPTGPQLDLDLVIIYEPRTLNDQQLNELANKLWYRYGTAVWTSTTPSARAPNARKSPTMTFPPPWAGWT